MAGRSALINSMLKAADKAAWRLKRDFGEVENLQVSRKGPADFVTAADLKAEEILRNELAKARPGYGFLLEEGGKTPASDESERRWIVDPLDGTSNFLHGLPHFAISIALEERGEILAGLVLDPLKNEIYHAEKGTGAYLNDRRLRVSGRSRLSESLIATGAPYMGHGDRSLFLAECNQIMAETAGIRRWGAASLDLAYVAAGRYDGFWEWGLSPWDTAAGIILVREAGGIVSQVDNRLFKLEGPSILASNGLLQTDLVKVLKNARQEAG
jgi:myo-inositol-1(or 4)-monophosphatase